MTTASVQDMTALSADTELLDAPLSLLSGRVHSVFRSVVNIEPAAGDLWCLATCDVAPGPRTVRVDRAAFTDLPIRPRMPVEVIGASLTVGPAAMVRVDRADRWVVPAVTGAPTAGRVDTLAAALRRLGVPGGALAASGLFPGLPPAESDDPRHTVAAAGTFGEVVAGRIASAVADLSAAVSHSDAAGICGPAAGLVGLGVGLTPAGDDVLTGFAYAAAQLGGPLASVPAAIADVATPSATNAISLVALRQACRGRAHQLLVDLLAAVCGGTASEITDATRGLVAIGHTSGTDQALGLMTAVRLHEEMRGH